MHGIAERTEDVLDAATVCNLHLVDEKLREKQVSTQNWFSFFKPELQKKDDSTRASCQLDYSNSEESDLECEIVWIKEIKRFLKKFSLLYFFPQKSAPTAAALVS